MEGDLGDVLAPAEGPPREEQVGRPSNLAVTPGGGRRSRPERPGRRGPGSQAKTPRRRRGAADEARPSVGNTGGAAEATGRPTIETQAPSTVEVSVGVEGLPGRPSVVAPPTLRPFGGAPGDRGPGPNTVGEDRPEPERLSVLRDTSKDETTLEFPRFQVGREVQGSGG